MLKQWNFTTITLVPKVPNLTYAKDFRPIACSSVLYKLVYKILTARLANVLSGVIDGAQAGLFLAVMPELGFPSQFISWIMVCLSSVSFSILINGIPSKPFEVNKGLRCLVELHLDLNFNYHPRCDKMMLTHLMFANDLLFFSKVDKDSITLLFQAFTKFCLASSLSANLDKSEVYFGGLSDVEQEALRSLIGVVPGTIPFKYLGVPLSSKKVTIAQCKPLVDKVTARINGWSAMHLSYAGRLQLVKSVVFGIQTYWAQIFVLPKKILKEMENIFRVFYGLGRLILQRNL
ncbi:uncharacterized protein LOC110702693 [Chenopodium quinoa]|uniref:uncharacterized protein LOC110702693 n=1 Tax=Chenopodium quinoa TaxID=63459 RepID=UPI000B770161|nr:uncharacterized protein LOC110702693 [Chenopodium quinoa]